MKSYYVYILRCSDGSYYTGMTNNIDERLYQHQSGFNNTAYTYRRRPVKLVYHVEFSDPLVALDIERQVKKWSRKKKEALITAKWDVLRKLAECKNETHFSNKESQ